MGTTLESVATARSRGRIGRSSLRLADSAARACLQRGARASADLDMLVNVGIHREDSLGEPALAALIQEDIGANPRHPPAAGHGTFSFDVANGPCGALTATYLLDGFMRSGVTRLGMVVASDVPPPGSRGYRLPCVGGALLLGWDDDAPGFTAFQFDTYPEYAELFHSRLEWQVRGRVGRGAGRSGRNRLIVRESPDYGARCVECASAATDRFLRGQGVVARELDLVAMNEPTPGFSSAFATRLGLPEQSIALPEKAIRMAHTAGLAAALEDARRRGQLATARTALFVVVGAGITVALALYRAERRD